MGREEQPRTQVGISCLLHKSLKVEKKRAGRIIRTQIGNSCLLHKSVEVEKIRAGRSNPGLR